jgi:hypothetical protein
LKFVFNFDLCQKKSNPRAVKSLVSDIEGIKFQNKKIIELQQHNLPKITIYKLPPLSAALSGIEPESRAPETLVLSIEL